MERSSYLVSRVDTGAEVIIEDCYVQGLVHFTHSQTSGGGSVGGIVSRYVIAFGTTDTYLTRTLVCSRCRSLSGATVKNCFTRARL